MEEYVPFILSNSVGHNSSHFLKGQSLVHFLSGVSTLIFKSLLAIIFLPGLMLYSTLIEMTTDDEDGDGTITKDEQAPMHYRIGFLLASLVFPATIMCAKVREGRLFQNG